MLELSRRRFLAAVGAGTIASPFIRLRSASAAEFAYKYAGNVNAEHPLTRNIAIAADKIREETIQLQALQDATPRDDAKVDAMSNQLIWETRIFEDRRKVVRFVCEVPTTIDQRLFALGRVIQQEME